MSDVLVRRATVDDAAAFARMMNEPAVVRGLMQVPYGSEALHRQRLADLLTPHSRDLQLVAERDGALVGSLGLHSPNPSPRRRHAMLLGISVVTAAHDTGVGSALMAAACDYADNWAQVLRLELTVFTDNAPGIALYRKFGFVEEGVHRAYAMREGQYCDVLAMARLHPNPPALPV